MDNLDKYYTKHCIETEIMILQIVREEEILKINFFSYLLMLIGLKNKPKKLIEIENRLHLCKSYLK